MDNNRVEKLMPDKVLYTAFDRLFPGKQKTNFLIDMVSSLVTAFLCYFSFMVNGYGGPDGVGEGVYKFRDFESVITGGRWFIGYVEKHLAGDAVIPFMIVIMYSILIGLSSHIMFRMIKIESYISQVLLIVFCVGFPIVNVQFRYLVMAPYFAYAFFSSVFGIYLVRARKVWTYILSVFCFITMFGSYQTYIGSVASLAVILVIIDLFDGRTKKATFVDFGLIVASGAVAAVIDLVIVKITVAHENMVAQDRMAEFSLGDILENFGFSFKYSRVWFYSYFIEEIIKHRNFFYGICLVALLVAFVMCLISLIKKKKFADAALTVVALLLIPNCMNLIQFLFPHSGIYDNMRYHYVLIFFLLFALVARINVPSVKCLTQWVVYLVVFVLLNTYILSANISGVLYKAIYTETYAEASVMLNRVFEVEGYEKDKTKVVMANTIDWMTSYNYYYKLITETNVGPGPVFWGGSTGYNIGRHTYFLQYFGVDFGLISEAEYEMICGSEEFEAMPTWPAEGSVKMINGYVVIKN